MATHPTCVTVIASFTLQPHRQAVWLATWGEVARIAASRAGCRRVCLLQDRSDSAHPIMLSEWETPAAFSRFWRETGLIWLEDALSLSSQFTFFEDASRETGQIDGDTMPIEVLLPVSVAEATPATSLEGR